MDVVNRKWRDQRDRDSLDTTTKSDKGTINRGFSFNDVLILYAHSIYHLYREAKNREERSEGKKSPHKSGGAV
jgi:hypothetical protein